MSPKDFFLWLAAMVTLYVSTISLLALYFEYIDVAFKDPLAYSDPYSTGIRLAIAALVVLFPVYILLTRVLNQDIRKNPAKRDLGIRRWLIFITLFVAGATIIIDLIVLINAFLGGEELTAGFLLKVLAVFVVIGDIFVYYFLDMRGVWERNEGYSKLIMWIVSAVILASVIGGFFIMGTPATQRELRYDSQKVNDLQNIQYQVLNYYQQKKVLPETLEALEDPLVGSIVPTDPQAKDGFAYTYEKVGALEFKLCATFNQQSTGFQEGAVKPVLLSVARYSFESEFWMHDAGLQCFTRTIDPEKFPVFKD